MKIIAVGLSHKTAPVEVREKIAFDSVQTEEALGQLREKFCECEFVLLSTCNRVEIYCSGSDDENIIIDFLSSYHGNDSESFKNYLYVHKGSGAVGHLMAVASGLDSMVVGEAQIFGQVKDSYRIACKAKSTGKILNRLFHCAFATAKKVSTQTAISGGMLSAAAAVVELAEQLFDELSSTKVSVIGAGHTAELVIKHLVQSGCTDITVISRSYESGARLADKYGVNAGLRDEISSVFADSDIVIAAAGGHDYLFSKSDVQAAISRRQKGMLSIIDAAVPRNFEPAVGQIEGVCLYSIDELAGIAQKNCRLQSGDIDRCRQIIDDGAAGFIGWFAVRDIGPLIGQMREVFAQIGQNEIERFFDCDDEAGELAAIAMQQAVNRMLHGVIKEIETLAKEQSPLDAMKLVDSIVQSAKETLNQDDKDNPCCNLQRCGDDKY